ncbi:cytochrome P450 [Streptomyces sp. NPDC050617]|uniref:cytochrome P450 n=1 Tax=Streptomyces sp. NPDC050617 TaxID=3154628 RepID=UPI00342C1477
MSQETRSARPYTRRDRFAPSRELRRLSAEAPLTKIATDTGTGTGTGVRADTGAAGTRWLATGYDVVRRILGDPARFSSSGPARTDAGSRPDGWLGSLLVDHDPPEHTRLRSMLTPEFTVRRIRRLEPRVEALAAERLDAMEAAGPPADLVSAFTWRVSVGTLCELIGVPRDDRADFERRSRAFVSGGRSTHGSYLTRYFAALLTRQRKDPDEGFIGMLVRDHGDRLTDEELQSVILVLLLAGIDNASSMLSLGALVLLDHPGQLAALRDDPALADRAVEELLRYLSVVHAPTARFAVEDVTIGDQLIKAGEQVICSLATANRDEALGEGMDRFDLTREPVPHLALGHGIHHCLGAALARMEMRVACLALLRRFPALRLAVPGDEVPFREDASVYGVERLPVSW